MKFKRHCCTDNGIQDQLLMNINVSKCCWKLTAICSTVIVIARHDTSGIL